MIAYLIGNILQKNDKGIILKAGNVGYFVHLPKSKLADLELTQELELFIHSHIREDAFDLYGFETTKELNFFKQLITVSGIGPKVAMEILSAPIEKISSAIANGDSAYLTTIPGIGGKTAQRIVLELKGKIEIENIENLQSPVQFGDEVSEALAKLGYQRQEINRFLRTMPHDIKDAETAISFFLRNV